MAKKPKATAKTKPVPSAKRAVARPSLLAIDGLSVPVEVRRHASARRLTLRVSRTRRAVVVTTPVRCRLDDVSVFVNKHLEWVRSQLGALPKPAPFADGMLLPLRGVMHRVRFFEKGLPRGAGIVSIVPRERASGYPELHVRGTADTAPRRLRDWLVKEAHQDLDGHVHRYARRLNLRPKRLSLRDQSSRWGSCSSTGVLSFSWRLILAPPHVLEYVAVHEVAHLAEMNHGPRFWALVKRAMPTFETAQCWLKAEGFDLHRYGTAANTSPPLQPRLC
jgi:predicted metal-dependent hydrolase